MSQFIYIQEFNSDNTEKSFTPSLYSIIFIEDKASFTVDGTTYNTEGNTVLFLSPYQAISWVEIPKFYRMLSFHSDFY
ncbi:MAG: hypothetical protein Q3992_06775 [Bacteroides sp.]|nr:hypothetical protein [Bacteroides sp.]